MCSLFSIRILTACDLEYRAPVLASCEIKQFGKTKMASPATSSSVMPPQSTVISGGVGGGGVGGTAAPPPPPPAGAPGGNPMYMLQWHEHHASFFRSVHINILHFKKIFHLL